MSAPAAIDVERMQAARYRRTLAAMDRAGTDLLLLSRTPNAFFVSGARRVQVAGSGGFVPWAVVRRGDPHPRVYTSDPDGVPAWMAAGCRAMVWDPARLIDDLRDLVSAPRPRIAVDAVSPRVFALLEAAFPGAEWQDGEAVLGEARAVKSDDEIAVIAEATAVAERVVAEVAAAVRPGARERELAGLASHLAIAAGASFLAAEADVRARPAAEVGTGGVIASGQPVTIEVAVVRGGVQGEAADTVFAGSAAPNGAGGLAKSCEAALDALAAACRPGASGYDLRAVAGVGVAGTPLLAHGIGTGVEPPRIDPRRQPDDALALRTGTVLVLTPEISHPALGAFRRSRTIVVGADGGRRIGGRP